MYNVEWCYLVRNWRLVLIFFFAVSKKSSRWIKLQLNTRYVQLKVETCCLSEYQPMRATDLILAWFPPVIVNLRLDLTKLHHYKKEIVVIAAAHTVRTCKMETKYMHY